MITLQLYGRNRLKIDAVFFTYALRLFSPTSQDNAYEIPYLRIPAAHPPPGAKWMNSLSLFVIVLSTFL